MQYLTISNNLGGSKTVIHLVAAGMPNRFIFKYKSGVEQNSLSFSQLNFTLSFYDVAFFTSKKPSEDKKIFILNLYDVALFTSTDKKWGPKNRI